LTTLFDAFVRHSLAVRPTYSWIVFADPDHPWRLDDPRVQVIRRFRSDKRTASRLFADHVLVPGTAKALGCDILVTTGFVPIYHPLPIAMQMFSLQHADAANGVGGLRRLYRKWAAGRGFRLANLVITNSQFAASQIEAAHPELARRLLVSYEGLDHSVFHPRETPGEAESLQGAFGIAPGYFLWVSNFYKYKQADLLLRGYALLPAATRKKAPLVMVGGDWGAGAAAVRTVAADLGIEADIRMLGWVDEKYLPALYRQAAAFCLSSREETFGRSVAEAMACGTPCIANDIPIMREVTGGSALLVDCQDREAVCGAMHGVLEDRQLQLRLRDEGIEGSRRFSFERLAEERLIGMESMLAAYGNGRRTIGKRIKGDGECKSTVAPGQGEEGAR
jgi:glycosyltransferase involved in cell wall biosynthesis